MNAAAPAPKTAAAARGKIWPWLILAAILLAYAATIAALRPAANFGSIQDDAIYFASAKSLAAGRGYLLPSFPGGAANAKYPELYPWLLSWVWRVDPAFPRNLSLAIALTVIFDWWFLAACYLFAKETLGLEDSWALVVTTICAFNFFALFLGGSVLSDLPFAALALTALLAADRSLQPGAHSQWGWMVASGALAGLSVGLRTVGVTVVAGIVLIAAIRRSWRQAGVLCLVGVASSLPWLMPALLRSFEPHPGFTQGSQGWTQTVAFYTSYVGQWRHFVPTWSVQANVIAKNLLSVFEEPGIFLLLPIANRSGVISVVAGSVVALAAWAGILLAARRSGWKAIHGAFLLYLAMIVPWPFPPHRFLAPFLPFLLGGLVVITREAVRWVAETTRPSFPVAKRGEAAALGAVLLAVGALAAANLAYAVPRQLAEIMRGQRLLLTQEVEAYRWIREHTPADARFIAYDDVLLYLYTGRQAIRPIAASTASAYEDNPAIARRDADNLDDVARHVAANYWLVSTADFGEEVGGVQDILVRRENELLEPFPVVFESDSGRIGIHSLRSAQSGGRGPLLR